MGTNKKIYALFLLGLFLALNVRPVDAKPNSCSDTDGGINILVVGITSGYYKNKYYSHVDYCVDSSNIREYFCLGAYEQSQQQSCGTDGYIGNNYCLSGDVYRDYKDYFCSGGKCDSSTNPVLQQDCSDGQYCSSGLCYWYDSCSDTDGGNVITLFGSTSGYLNNNLYNHDDYCVDSSNIREYFCLGAYEQSQQQSCGTDGDGNAYCSGNLVYRDYTDYFCFNGACDLTVTPELQENCDNYDHYGSNYCYNSTLVYRDYTDYFCSGGNCDYSTIPEFVEYCQYGCTNGVCDSPPPDLCFDSDEGLVIEVQGTTSGYLNGQPYNNTDYCISSFMVREYYCWETQELNVYANCTQGATCLNGACV